MELDEELMEEVLLKELVDEVLEVTGDDVLVVMTDEVELVLKVVVVLVTVVDPEGGSFPQGWLDSKSVAT